MFIATLFWDFIDLLANGFIGGIANLILTVFGFGG